MTVKEVVQFMGDEFITISRGWCRLFEGYISHDKVPDYLLDKEVHHIGLDLMYECIDISIKEDKEIEE